MTQQPAGPGRVAGNTLVVILTLVGLRPLTEKVHSFIDALIARVKGGAS